MVSAGFGRSDHIRNVIYTRHYHDTDGLRSKTLSVYTHAAQGKLSWEVYHTFTSALYEIRITSKVRTVWSKLCTYVSSKGSRFHVGHWVQPDYQAFWLKNVLMFLCSTKWSLSIPGRHGPPRPPPLAEKTGPNEVDPAWERHMMETSRNDHQWHCQNWLHVLSSFHQQ